MLVGTVSIEKSELLSEFLEPGKASTTRSSTPASTRWRRTSSPRPDALGAVTIATNMAGRGTDIQLGGNLEFRTNDESGRGHPPNMPERDEAIARIKQEIAAEKEAVLAAGGLFVLGTERHESRRIDNQLRGRSGRQGDPGLSRFYLSLDDDLLRIFGPDTLFAKMMRNNIEDGEAIGSKWLSKAIETAQKKVEARNYDIRKQVVEYDDVMNDQRKVIYEQRSDIMDAEGVGEMVEDMRAETVNHHRRRGLPAQQLSRTMGYRGHEGRACRDAEPDAADRRLAGRGGDRRRTGRGADPGGCRHGGGGEGGGSVGGDLDLGRKVDPAPESRPSLEGTSGPRSMRCARSSICGAYAQKTPINEYKQEAFSLFQRMLDNIRTDVTKTIAFAEFQMQQPAALPDLPDFITTHFDPFTGMDDSADIDAGTMGRITTQLPALQIPQPDPVAFGEDPAEWQGVVSRNAPCPCGSGNKYKHCHGAVTA